MSKINKVRFVNLNYNNNSMKIDDETFFLDCENTMFNLRNGGGKSVLVQMMISPFVHKRYRSFKDRPFESYFTKSTPTYILVEWKLDNGGGYVLTGIMVRKRETVSDEDSKEKLDIISFVSEYTNPCECDIDNIKIVDKDGDRKSVKSYANSKKLFEALKKNESYKFSYYDMTNSASTKMYFDRLLSYKINYKEWENVIKKINLKESGLSELFSTAKNVEGLMKEWFLPAIENKLNKDEDRIKNFREIISGYIMQYKENKHNIDKKAKVELFNNLSAELHEECNKYINTINNRENLENKMANSIDYLKHTLFAYETDKCNLENALNDLNESLKDLEYEEKSLSIYKLEDKKSDLHNKVDEKMRMLASNESQRDDFRKKLNIFTCAKLYKEYKEKSEELQNYENKLKVLSSENKDFAPRINDLGFTIKTILSKELSEADSSHKQSISLKKSLNDDNLKIDSSIEENNNTINEMSKQLGELKTAVIYFDKEEDNFNKKYDEKILRNIEGYFNERDILLIDKKINDYGRKLDSDRKTLNERIYNFKDSLKSLTSEKDSLVNKNAQIEKDIEYKEDILKTYDEDIRKRKEIIKYVDLDESYVFDTNKIRELFYRKIESLRDDEKKLLIVYEKKNEEVMKLESGRVLELPKDVERELKKRDIDILFGMDWIKNNNYSEEENKKFIKNNPFIPYSLIMDDDDIKMLKENPISCYTSSPISIVKRENLIKDTDNDESSILSMGSVDFIISFNSRLLNEEELLKIIDNKKNELSKINNDIEAKKESIRFYESKKNIVEKSDVTLEKYNNLKDTIESLKGELENTKSSLIKCEKYIQNTTADIDTAEKDIKHIDKEIDLNKNKRESYDSLIVSYNKYKENKDKLQKVKEIIVSCENAVRELRKKKTDNELSLSECEEKILFYRDKIKEINNNISVYNMYNSGNLIEKDSEDLIAEFKALTKKISESENDLKEKIELCNKKYKEIESELIEKSKKYNLIDSEYMAVSYDVYKENEAEDNLEKTENAIRKLNDEAGSLKGELKFIENTLLKDYKDLKDIFGCDKPKDRSLIFNKNYKEEKAEIEIKIKENKDEFSKVNAGISKIENSLSSVSEYGNVPIKEKIEVSINIDDLDEVLGKMKRDISKLKSDEGKNENSLQRAVYKIQSNDEFKDESFFKEPIETLLSLVSKPHEFNDQLNMINESYDKLMEKLSCDINLIEEEQNNILGNLLDYIEIIHDNISKIDSNSSINIKGRRIKMLNMIVPDWSENEDLYKVKLKNYIEQLRNQCIITLENNESIEEIISNTINTSKLYDEVVSLSSINIKLYKIEEDKQRQISWNEVSSNSGGEGFLSAFVILSSLLSYMRKDENDIFSRKEEGKVLIMDNPFAQTNAAHLLKPLMDVAKKSNTQLICLTGLGGDSIYNRFDNIYVLKLVSSKIKTGIKYLKAEHAKGEEDNKEDFQVIDSARFKIEEAEQTRLF